MFKTEGKNMIIPPSQIIQELTDCLTKMQSEMSTEDYQAAVNDFSLWMGGTGVEFVANKKKRKRCLKK